MYLNFYGFTEKPFNLFADPNYLYLSSKHRAALAHLDYGLTDQSGFIVITGDVGTGKTTLLKHVVRNLDDRVQVAMVFNTTATPLELVQMILREYDLCEHQKNRTQCYQMLYDFFLDQFSRGNQCLLFIDEAQGLSSAGLEEIRMLSNLNEGKDTLLQIILAGQPSFQLKLERKDMRQFAQRVTMDFVLEPLEPGETREYVLHRMKVAGRENGDTLFTPDAHRRIYEFSRGVPRLINILCDGALVYGFADELTTIDAPVIHEVVKDKKIRGQFYGDTQAPGQAARAPATVTLVQKLNAMVRRLTHMEQMLTELRGENNNGTVRKLETLLAQERERTKQTIHECGQKDALIKALRQRMERLEKQLKARN